MTLILATVIQPAFVLASGAPVGLAAAEYCAAFSDAIASYRRDKEPQVLLAAVEGGLREAPSVTGVSLIDPEERARLAVSMARVHSQSQAASGLTDEALRDCLWLLEEEARSFLFLARSLLPGCRRDEGEGEGGFREPVTEPAIPLRSLTDQNWGEITSDLTGLGDRLRAGELPLVHGLGAVGLGLGSRIALKVDAACFFSALSGYPVEASARTYLYGHTPSSVEELNRDHVVRAKMPGAPGAWVHHGVSGVGYERWRPLRRSSRIQVAAIDSQNFVSVLCEHDYQFFRDLPENAILVSPIKSQIPEELYGEITADYARAFEARHGESPPPLVGGASMEELYTMLKVITGRTDVRTVHIGGEYFAKDLFLYRNAPPGRSELVFASSDLEAAREAARWFAFPDHMTVSVTDDVTTVLLGGVMKNIVAYALGENDLAALEAAWAAGEKIWKEGEDREEQERGENGYVMSPDELVGARREWWDAYVAIAQVLGDRSSVAVPREILRDFCGCTRSNRLLVQEKFWAIREAYDAGDWGAFRRAVEDFKESLPQMADSRNRRGGLLHNMALFVKEELRRPEEARLLYTGETIEGYKALRGLHHRLEARGRHMRGALGPVYHRFYTVTGIPTHPELDPLVPPSVRHAVVAGLTYRHPLTGREIGIPADWLGQIFATPRLSRRTYEFVSRMIVTIAGHLGHQRPGEWVERDFQLLRTALEMVVQGVEIHAGRHVARHIMPPYRNVIHYEGAHRHGKGGVFHRYFIQMAGNPDHQRLEDVAILLSHHQAQARGEAPEVSIRIMVEGGLAGGEEVVRTMQRIVSRFRQYQKDGIAVVLEYTDESGGVVQTTVRSPPSQVGLFPDLQGERDRGLAALASLTDDRPDRLARHFAAHTDLIREIVGQNRWSGLIQTGRDKYSGAFRDALHVPGERAFFGIFTEPEQEYPDEIVVASLDRNGEIRLVDSRVFGVANRQAAAHGWEQADLFGGLSPELFLERFRVVAPSLGIAAGSGFYLRPLPIRQFPPEEILVGMHREHMRPIELFEFMRPGLPGRETATDRFLAAIQPYYYIGRDPQVILDIRELIGRLQEEPA